MQTILLVVHTILTVALIVVILLQRSSNEGFGTGGGGGALMTGRAKASLLTRTTALLATGFMLTSLGLAYIAASGHESSIVDRINEKSPLIPGTVQEQPVEKKEQPAEMPAEEIPEVPVAQ